MNLLKRENWWIWIILFLISKFFTLIILGASLKVFEKNAWYTKWYLWVFGVFFIIPLPIMCFIFVIDILTKCAKKLNVENDDIYLSPYVWVLFLIVPFMGWLCAFAVYVYLIISIIIKLYRGEGEYLIN